MQPEWLPRRCSLPDRPADHHWLARQDRLSRRARQQYLPALTFFAVLPFVDMIIACKILIVVVWVGAGFSKFGKHFSNVIPPMISNSPAVPFTWIKRLHYRDFPHDMKPSRVATVMAHVGGTFVEIAAPLVLLLSTTQWLTVAAVALMVCFHLFIVSTFPSRFRWSGTSCSVTQRFSFSWDFRHGTVTHPGTCHHPGSLW